VQQRFLEQKIVHMKSQQQSFSPVCITAEALLSALHVQKALLRKVLVVMLKSQPVTLRHDSLLMATWHTYQIYNKPMSIDLHQLLIVLTMQAETLVMTSSCVTTHLQQCLQYCCSPAGALLFDARQLFEQQNARADEALRSIVGQLAEAVTTCVDAAATELDPVRQAALMKVQGPALMPLPS